MGEEKKSVQSCKEFTQKDEGNKQKNPKHHQVLCQYFSPLHIHTKLNQSIMCVILSKPCITKTENCW